jgi:DNA-directed RNA polymerase subunit RPC12/RpoP
MIYEALKSLVDWLKTSYKCPECSEWISDSNIDIVWAAWNTVNFDIECPKCGKHWMIKSQMVMLNIDWLTKMKHSIEGIKNKLEWTKESEIKITDNEIIALDKNLKNKQINVSDLFK